jgi:hypothetical protein
MRMLKIISGGQTGADRTFLEIAKELGFETGGFAPMGWKTENGPDPTLGSVFGLVESHTWVYSTRTKQNVELADVTVWFGQTQSPGFQCTRKWVINANKPFLICPTQEDLLAYIRERKPTVLNGAGNRLSRNPKIKQIVRETVYPVLFEIRSQLELEAALERAKLGGMK